MFITAFAIFIRPATGQITIGNNKAFSFPPKSRKLFLNDYRVDKTVSRLRRG
jgi:hypothetical protein